MAPPVEQQFPRSPAATRSLVPQSALRAAQRLEPSSKTASDATSIGTDVVAIGVTTRDTPTTCNKATEVLKDLSVTWLLVAIILGALLGRLAVRAFLNALRGGTLLGGNFL